MTSMHMPLSEYACACPVCHGDISPGDTGAEDYPVNSGSIESYALDPSNPVSGDVGSNADNGKPIWSAHQSAHHLLRGQNSRIDLGGDAVVTYSFPGQAQVGENFQPLDAQSEFWMRNLFDRYAEVSGLTFVEVGDNAAADIKLRYREDGGGVWNGQWATAGRNPNPSNGNPPTEPKPGTGLYELWAHEVGHGLGLAHGGDYNGSGFNYNDDADHWNDTDQYTFMSYFSQRNTGGSGGPLSTLGLHDILAIQIEYGVNWDTRADDTVYGYNQTTGVENYDLNYNPTMSFSIWDGGGMDTLDLSGSSSSVDLDLRDGAFSSVNNRDYNISIAYGAVIENGVGGDRGDTLRGNEVANTLWGGEGDDLLIGGENAAPSAARDPRAFVGVEMNKDPETDDQYASAFISDMPGSSFTIEMMFELDRMHRDGATLISFGRNDEVEVRLNRNDTIRIAIDGESAELPLDVAGLIDGSEHHFSMTWDSLTGQTRVYVDGELAGETSLAQNGALLAQGTMVVGQELSQSGQLNLGARREFDGVIGEVRLFDRALTAQDVAVGAFETISPNTGGLLHYWRADSTGSSELTDVVGGADLSLANGAAIGDTQEPVVTDPDNDTLYGGDGADEARGGSGGDRLFGENGDDELYGESGADLLIGGAGDDLLDGGGGVDTAKYAGSLGDYGVRAIENGAAVQVTDLRGGDDEGVDTLRGVERIEFEDGLRRMLVAGTDGDDLLAPTADNDLIIGNGGADEVRYAGAVSDYAVGYDEANDGFVISSASGGSDLVVGVERFAFAGVVFDRDGMFDVIDSQDDVPPPSPALSGVADSVSENSQAGLVVATLTGDAPGYVITNAAGTPIADPVFEVIGDELRVKADAALDYEALNEGSRLELYVAATDGVLTSAPTPISLLIEDVAEQLALANGGVTFRDRAVNELGIDGGSGDDFIYGGDGDDVISGGGGADAINGGVGDDQLQGGAGADLLRGNSGDDELRGGDDADQLYGGGGADQIFGDGGDDFLSGVTGNDELYGGAGNDTLFGKADDDLLDGGVGDDRLTGNSGDDRLIGGDGEDRLAGGGGDDVLIGGDGRDFYIFGDERGADIIEDFQVGSDLLVLRNRSFGDRPLAYEDLEITASGADTIITDRGLEITLEGVDASLITPESILI